MIKTLDWSVGNNAIPHTCIHVLHIFQYSELDEVAQLNGNEDPIYWPPENDPQKIYEQLEQKKYREIPRELIQ